MISIISVSLKKKQQPEAKLSFKVSFESSRANSILVSNSNDNKNNNEDNNSNDNNKKPKILEVERRNNEQENAQKSTNSHRRLWVCSNDDERKDAPKSQRKAITTIARKIIEKYDGKNIFNQQKNNKKVKVDTKLNTKMKTTKATKLKRPAKFAKQPASDLKSDFPTSFINPFGQLSAFFSSDHLQFLQDYSFLFRAERDTIFQLHSISTMTVINNDVGGKEERVFNKIFGTTSGVNSVSSSECPTTRTMVEEVRLYNATSLRQSRFSPFNPTRILIHGWFGGSNAGVYKTLVPEYLKLQNGTYNVFTVDWGRGAIADYITASYRVKPVGKVLAKFIDFLHRESGMRFEDLHIIGFSMGAHVAGIAGKFVQTGRLPIIYALDPALPLFRYENINERIALTDADYVEVIHTSVGSYGYDRPLGHVDFYVNYGSGQPGCFFNECNHIRAFQVFAESLHNPNAFRGYGCDVGLWLDLIKNRRCLMGTGRNLTMGGNPIDLITLRKRGGGVYYLPTNLSPPYGRG